MAISWPSTVPLTVKMDGYGEQIEEAKIKFTPDVGPSVERPRSTIASDLITFAVRMTFTEYDLFAAFYRTTLKQGTQPFYRPHPRRQDGLNYKFKFTDVPKMTPVSNTKDQCDVSMQVRKMP